MRTKVDGTREALLEAGNAILRQSDYKQLKIKDIARSAGVSTGTFYSYFKDKRSFAMTILKESWSDAVSRADSVLQSERTVHDRLKAIYGVILSFERDMEETVLQVTHDYDIQDFLCEYNETIAIMSARIEQVILDGISSGEITIKVTNSRVLSEITLRNLVILARNDYLTFDEFYKYMYISNNGRETVGNIPIKEILDSTATMIFWKDADRRFLGMNKAFLDYYGFSSEKELLGKTDEDMGWHSDPDPFKNDEVFVLNGGTTRRVHGKCFAKGSERDIVASKSPVYDNGSIIGLVGSFDDVTTEYNQRNEIGRLNNIINAIPGGISIFRKRFDKLYCAVINSYLLSMLGGREEDYIDKSIEELLAQVHPDDRKLMVERAGNLALSGLSSMGLYRFFDKVSGEYVWIQIEGRLVRMPNDEELIYFLYTNVDELESAKSKLEVSRRLYEFAANSAGLFLWTYDIKSRTIYFDDSEYTLKRRQQLGLDSVIKNAPEHMRKLLYPEDTEAFDRMYADIHEGMPFVSCEVRYRPSHDQRLIYLRISYTMEFDNSGKVVKGYGMARDITKEKRLAAQYEREESFVRVDTEPRYIAKGHYNLTRNKALEYWRIWKSAMNVLPDMTYDQVAENIMSYIASDEDKIRCREFFNRKNLISKFNAGETNVSIEYQRSGDGLYAATWAVMEFKLFTGPVSGDVECFVYLYDTTEKHIRQQTAANLQEIGYEFVGLINVSTGRATYFRFNENNDGMEVCVNTNDYETASMQQLDSYLYDCEKHSDQEYPTMDAIIRELDLNDTYSYMRDLRTDNGTIKRVQSSFRYIDDNKNVIYNSIRDITREYQEEQAHIARLNTAMLAADRANALKSQFLSNVSHDIRTPLNAILGYDNMAMETDDVSLKNEYLKKIAIAGDTLLSLINDTLDLQKIESGAIDLKPEPVLASDAIRQILTAVMPLMNKKNIRFELDYGNATDAVLEMDTLRIQKIFINLLSNAIKFTHDGGIIKVTITSSDTGSGFMHSVIEISDNGIGMSREFLPNVFEPFTQERNDENAGITGTGLGLSIVKSLVEIMNGSISVESELGAGTTFTVCLDLRISQNRVGSGSASLPQKTASISGTKILLVEDNAMNTEIAMHILTSHGAVVETAQNGQAGCDKYLSSPPGTFDIILMDIRMPIMDGYKATEIIRRSGHKGADSIPIIAMTADAYSEDMEKSRAVGMSGHISKPIDTEELLTVISKSASRGR